MENQIEIYNAAYALLAWFASWLLEWFPAWHNIPKEKKEKYIITLSVLVVGSVTIIRSQPAWLEFITPYAKVVGSTILFWLTTQLAHKFRPKEEKQSGAQGVN